MFIPFRSLKSLVLVFVARTGAVPVSLTHRGIEALIRYPHLLKLCLRFLAFLTIPWFTFR